MKPLLMYEARSENQISDPKDLHSQVKQYDMQFYSHVCHSKWAGSRYSWTLRQKNF